MTGRNPWAILGVAEDATYPEVQRAYRRRVKQTHPDSGGDADEFATVVHAFHAVRVVTPLRRCQPPARPTPYDSWLTSTPSTRSWTERAYPTQRVPNAPGSSRVVVTGPAVGGGFAAVLGDEMARTGSVAAGH